MLALACGVLLGCSVDATQTLGTSDFETVEQELNGNGNSFGNQPFLIDSPNFADGAALPYQYTCEGNLFGSGVSPELNWTKGPKGTKSYAIVFIDTTIAELNQPNFAYHWAVWNIPHDRHTLPEGIIGVDPAHPTLIAPLPASLKGATQSQARGVSRFFGPCPSWTVTHAINCGQPPVARTTDHYAFVIYALPEHDFDVPAHDPSINPNYVDRLNTYFSSIALGQVQVTATSDAVPTTTPPVPCP